MTKEDLKYGNVVETKDGERYIYLKFYNGSFLNLKSDNGDYILADTFDSNFKNIYNSKYDIMKIYKDYTLKELLWEKKENQN